MGFNPVRFCFSLTHTSKIHRESGKRSHPKGNITYTHHVLLDVCRHLFGQKPSREQDVDEAVFGFGVVDNKIICGGIIFPLFISDHEKGRCSFTYLGNYTATKLEPVTWDELSNEVRFASFHERSLKLTSTRYSIRGWNPLSKLFNPRVFQQIATSVGKRKKWSLRKYVICSGSPALGWNSRGSMSA